LSEEIFSAIGFVVVVFGADLLDGLPVRVGAPAVLGA
jgi:hypothetical protein